MKIRAAVLEQFAEPLVDKEVELEGPEAREVVVRLHACGVCHTDGGLPKLDVSRERDSPVA